MHALPQTRALVLGSTHISVPRHHCFPNLGMLFITVHLLSSAPGFVFIFTLRKISEWNCDLCFTIYVADSRLSYSSRTFIAATKFSSGSIEYYMPSHTLCQQRRVGSQGEGSFAQMISWSSFPTPSVYDVSVERDDETPWAWIPPGFQAGAQEVLRALGLLSFRAQKQCPPSLECLPEQHPYNPKDALWRKTLTSTCLKTLNRPKLQVEFRERGGRGWID